MKPITIKHSEEHKGLTTLILSNNAKMSFPTQRLLDFIQEHELNRKDEVLLVAGSGIVSDPNNVEEEVESWIPIDQYLDENWDELILLFHTQVLSKD